MTGISLAPIGMLLLVACLIAMLSRRFGLPYIVGLVVAGFLVALLPNAPQLPLSRELIFNVLLPPLVFEAALQLNGNASATSLPLTLFLAFAGVAIAAALVAAGMHVLVGWSWIGAALFGVLIAATDPVSVIATFRETRCDPRVSMVVESESLLNDGVAAVGFAVLSAIAAGASANAASVVPQFLWTLGGGLAIGLAVSAAILLIVGRTDDPLVEITLTTLAAYGSFLLAEHVHASGIISALAAGLMVGNIGWGVALSNAGKERVLHAWEYFAFLANSLVFILIGMKRSDFRWRSSARLAVSPSSLSSAAGRFRSILWPLCSAGRGGDFRQTISILCSGADYAEPWHSLWHLQSPTACRSAAQSSSPLSSSLLSDPGSGPDHAVAHQTLPARSAGCREVNA